MVQPVQDQSKHAFSNQTSQLQRHLESSSCTLTIQLPSLLTTNASNCVQQLAAQAHLFDAVLVANAPGGAVGISSVAMAVLLKRAGVEAVVQVSGRDRNRLALQGDLLGLSALNIHNLLVDMQPVTRASLEQHDARLVSDLDGPALLATAVRMRDEGHFISGASIKQPPLFYAGALLSLKEDIEFAALKGAQFFVTRPVDDIQRFVATLAAFQSAHPDFLSSRPLLVSLPQMPPDVLRASIEELKGRQEISGFNLAVARESDLASLTQIIHMVGIQR